MKTFCVVLLFVASAFARSSNVVSMHRPGPLACPLPEPVESESGVLNITLHPIVEIFEGSTRGRLVVHGLSTLVTAVDVNIITLNAMFEVNLETVDLTCQDVVADGWVDLRPIRPVTLPSGNFTGTGAATLTGSKVHLKGNAVLFVNLIGNKVSVRILNLESVSFDSLAVNLGANFLVNGSPVNWDELNASLKSNFDQDFAQFKTEITEKIRTAANVIVGQYTLAELIDLIGGGDGGDGGDCATTPAQ